ncbi:MAG: PASTA domain-containing protein [Acidobacteria bacterium]|nr:PASTA domain-containing protein [Acidobacteriota bacterium]
MPSLSSYLASFGRVIFVLGVSTVTFVAGGWVVTRLAVSGPADRVPDLRGLADTAALAELEAAGMVLEIDEDRLQANAVPADHVVRQDPAPGTQVKRMRTVRVMLSTGPLELVVPNHVGDARQRALIRLEQQGVQVDYVASAPSYDVPRDTIIAQSPPADAPPTEAQRPLRLLSSLGPPIVYYVMPNLVTHAVGDVRSDIEARGFRVSEGSNRRVHANVPPGTIVAQSPQPGFRIAAGGEIVLEVSR